MISHEKGLMLALAALGGMAYFVESQRCILFPAHASDRSALEAGFEQIAREYRLPFTSLDELTMKKPDCCEVAKARGLLGCFTPDYWYIRLKPPKTGSTEYWYTFTMTRCGDVTFIGRVS